MEVANKSSRLIKKYTHVKADGTRIEVGQFASGLYNLAISDPDDRLMGFGTDIELSRLLSILRMKHGCTELIKALR